MSHVRFNGDSVVMLSLLIVNPDELRYYLPIRPELISFSQEASYRIGLPQKNPAVLLSQKPYPELRRKYA